MSHPINSHEFKVNKYITLKLEGKEVNIYINNELFNQCAYVLVNKRLNKLEELNEIESIDNFTERAIQPDIINIPIETQFWVHCSNLQAWVEHNYDTRLLHSNLAFPLLKKLADLGDSYAKERFKEEVVSRFNEGNDYTRGYIISMNYMKYIEDYNKYYAILNEGDANALIQIITKYKKKFQIEEFIPTDPKFKDSYIMIKNKHIHQIGLRFDKNCPKIPKEVNNFKSLEGITVYIDNMNFNTDEIKFPHVKYLTLSVKRTSKQVEIKKLDYFQDLESLTIESEEKNLKQVTFSIIKPIIQVPNNIGKLKKLKVFGIYDCFIPKLPFSIGQLNNLIWLILYDLDLKSVPENTFTLNNLEVVNLIKTKLDVIPETILNNQSIQYFACEPSLITTEIKEWLDKRELVPLGDTESVNTFCKLDFFNYPVF